MDDAVVSVRSLTRRFGKFIAVDSVDFDVTRGEIFGFLGANGAGKSTTIRMLCGILPPSSGKAELLGIDVAKHPERIKQAIGYMSQKFSLYNDLTVRENISFFGGIHRIDSETLAKRTEEILDLAELRGKKNLLTGSLAGGYKQRLALGCSILHRPGILFLDEPTAGVDPVARKNFWEIIYELRERGTTVFVTSHYMDEVEQCDRVALMHRGRIAALDAPEKLKKNVIPGPILSLRCDRGGEAGEILRAFPELVRVDPAGSGFHAVTNLSAGDSGEVLLEKITQRFEEEGIVVRELLFVEPSLEDVFVYLIGGLEASNVA